MESFLVHWGYVAVFVVTAVSAFGIPVGSELVMAYAGAIASGLVLTGTHHHLSLGVVIAVAIAGELVGSLAGYALGRFGGRPLIDKVGRYLLLTHRDLDRVEDFLARRGDSFVFVGRLVPLLRSFVSIVAGLAEMTIGRFLVFTIAGSAVFSAAVVSLGYSLGSSYHTVVKGFSDAGYVALAIAVVAVAFAFYHRLKAVREERAAQLAAGPAGAATAVLSDASGVRPGAGAKATRVQPAQVQPAHVQPSHVTPLRGDAAPRS